MMKTRHTWLLLAFVGLFAIPARAADDKPLQNPALKDFYSSLKTLFRSHYPEVTSHLLNDKIHFEHNTRIYIVHVGDMTGVWQDPWEERGPKSGGILCDIVLREGQWLGQAMVPQTFDYHYFKKLLAAPYSPKLDKHLEVHLTYPGKLNDDFKQQFNQLINYFEKHVDRADASAATAEPPAATQ